MTFLPVVERELRVAARKARTYWGRFLAGGVAFVLLAWIWLVTGHRTASEVLAKQLFGTLSTVALIYALIAGLTLTADSISEEKREGTLGLLFLTDLKGYDVVLGKLFATSLHAFYGLIAIFPVMAIPLLLGGLTSGDFWRMTLVLLDSLFLSLSVGMLASSISVHDRKAQGAAFFLMLAVVLLVPWFGIWVGRLTHTPGFVQWNYTSPVMMFIWAFDEQYKINSEHYWNSVWVVLAFAWLSLLIASIVVRRTWQFEGRRRTFARVRQKWEAWKNGGTVIQHAYRSKLLTVNPFYWLASRDRMKPIYVIGMLLIAAIIWAGLYWKHRREMLDPFIFFTTAFLLHLAVKLWVASEAGKQIAEDKRTGALELLISTPLNTRQILDGQFLALLRQFGWAVLIILGIDFLMMLKGARAGLRSTGAEWIMIFMAIIIIFVADLFVIATVGMWLGLTSRRSTRATAKTIFYILLLPWLIFCGFLTLVGLSSSARAASPGGLIGAWFVIAALVDVFCFAWASGNLTEKFREIVTQRFDAPK
jgi:hypothetical protein